MATYTHIDAVKPADEQWQRMVDVYMACRKAGVAIPMEVREFFAESAPDEAGVVIRAACGDETHVSYITSYEDDYHTGMEITVADIPKDVKLLRIYRA